MSSYSSSSSSSSSSKNIFFSLSLLHLKLLHLVKIAVPEVDLCSCTCSVSLFGLFVLSKSTSICVKRYTASRRKKEKVHSRACARIHHRTYPTKRAYLLKICPFPSMIISMGREGKRGFPFIQRETYRQNLKRTDLDDFWLLFSPTVSIKFYLSIDFGSS